MRPRGPYGGVVARVVLNFCLPAPAPVFGRKTVSAIGFSPSIGSSRGLAFRGAFTRFEAV